MILTSVMVAEATDGRDEAHMIDLEGVMVILTRMMKVHLLGEFSAGLKVAAIA